MKKYTDTQLKSIFKSTESTLLGMSSMSKFKINQALKPLKTLKVSKRTDKEYFQKMVDVAFYSGFKASTVSNRLGFIHKEFEKIEKVAKYGKRDISRIMREGKVIKHEKKISGTIRNAKEFLLIKQEYGSFDKFLASFGDHKIQENLDAMIKNMKRRFAFLGKITVYHFLTDLGYSVLKPDRVLSRIFSRLDLVDDKNDYWDVVEVGRRISRAARLPIRYIDIVFVNYGQVGKKEWLGLSNGVCLEKMPLCKQCGIYKYCSFQGKTR